MRRFAALSGLVLAVAGCALKGDVRKVELRVQALEAQTARADSARAAQLDSLVKLITATQAALEAQRQYLTTVRGETRSELLNVERLLVQLQELAGVSQQRITELRAQLDQRAQTPLVPPEPAGGGGGQPPSGPGSALPGPDQMFDLSLQQLRRGSLGTARTGFREFLKQFPTDQRAADALYYIGESFAVENPDSAAAVYEQVVNQYANSPRAPSALYKLGLLAEQRGQRQAARNYYNRVVSRFPQSDEAALARDRLQRLGR